MWWEVPGQRLRHLTKVTFRLPILGNGSKAVITGDATQVDLPAGKPSGLKEAWRILKEVPGIRFVTFTEKDVARHHLVQEIIAAYERDDNQSAARDPLEKA